MKYKKIKLLNYDKKVICFQYNFLIFHFIKKRKTIEKLYNNNRKKNSRGQNYTCFKFFLIFR